MGAAKPLIRHARHDPEIHGADGLGGVRGLPDANSNIVKSIVSPIKAIDGMAASMKFVMDELREKVSIVSCGPMTNVALFISVYPELLYCVEEIVFMGGGVGIGNRGAVAGEYPFQSWPALVLTWANAQNLTSSVTPKPLRSCSMPQ